MRSIVLAAAAVIALAGYASAQEGHGGRRGLFQADANSDGTLTRQEFDAGHDSHFGQMDANSDGFLSREEMRAMRREHGRRGRGHGGHMLERADANNDGAITREEFLAGPTAHFDRLDADNDGVISAAERPQRRERGGHGEHGEQGGRPNMDADGDGRLSRPEFAAMGAAHFARLDANNDGQVTEAEASAGHPHRRSH